MARQEEVQQYDAWPLLNGEASMDVENPEWTEADIKSAVRFDALLTFIEAFKEGESSSQTGMNDAR